MSEEMSNTERHLNQSHQVGYGKPPRDSRFKAGQSGNPKGRKKGAKTIRGVMKAAINEKISVSIGGKTKRMTKLEAIVQKTIASSLSGDAASTRLFFQMLLITGLQHEVEDALSADHMDVLGQQDQAMFDRFLSGHIPDQADTGNGTALHTPDIVSVSNNDD